MTYLPNHYYKMVTQDERVDPIVKAKVFSSKIYEFGEDENRKCIKCKISRKVFKVDIPQAFFNEEGEFIAKPKYEEGETLHIKWTGYGRYYGWIDTNVKGRGRGGAGGEGADCAKWS